MEYKSNFISLEASAGSGKTHNLAKRYISLLLDFDSSKNKPPLNNILALTFANKATVEMKERIIKYLKKMSLKQDVKDVLTAVNISKSKIPANAYMAVNDIIKNFDHFNVRTIDSFINLIIKACALKLEVSPNYKIVDTYEDYIDYSIDAFLDKSFEDDKVRTVLDSFFEQYNIDGSSSWNIRKNIFDTFKKLYKKEIIKKISEGGKNTKYFEGISKINSKFINLCKDILTIDRLDEYTRTKIKDYAEKIVSGKTTLFKDRITSFFANEDIEYKKNCKRNAKLEECFKKGKAVICEFMEFRAKHFYDNYIKMFDPILDEFDKRAKIDSVMFLQDINKQVAKVFYEENLAPEIYLSLSNNFTDFLIDEFQDTNQLQWQTLKLIVEENLSKGGSFFYVGDKKQAIYGFRGGDYKIFDVPRLEFKKYNQQDEFLDTNYRSCKAIVDFNNQLYCRENIIKLLNAFGKEKNLNNIDKYCKGIIEVFKNSQQKCNKKETGYVEVSYKEYSAGEDVDEIVKQYLYDTIEDINKRFLNKDITIICRTNDEIKKIGEWLLEKNIEIESFQTLNIVNSQIIKELFSVLQFLNMPIDNVSFISFITSSVFLKATGLTKEDILKFISENMIGERKIGSIYMTFREKYFEVWKNYIEEFFNRAGFVAVYEMVVSLISKYKVLDNFKEYSNIIYRFLEVVCDFEKNNQGLGNFIDYFTSFAKKEKDGKNDKFFIKIPSSNAIKITTMHKSKGLEFNVVIIPYFYIKQLGSNDNTFPVENEDEVSFLRITKNMTTYSEYLKDIYYEKHFKNMSDELNGLYVSTTRAICEFYGLILHKKETKESVIEVLVDKDKRIFGKKEKINIKSKDEDEEKVNDIEITSTQLEDIVDIINSSSTEIYGKKHKDVLLKGKIIHYALSQITTFNLNNLQNVVEQAVTETQNMFPEQSIDWLKDKITNLLSNKDIAVLFDEGNVVFNEKEYVDGFGNTIRLDKIILKQDSVIVADFKNSIYDKEYINRQMEKYVETIKEIYPEKKICCYVVDVENVILYEFNNGTI